MISEAFQSGCMHSHAWYFSNRQMVSTCSIHILASSMIQKMTRRHETQETMQLMVVYTIA